MNASEGMKFGSHPLLDCVQQLHTADPLQLFRNPVSKTYKTHTIFYILSTNEVYQLPSSASVTPAGGEYKELFLLTDSKPDHLKQHARSNFTGSL